MSFNRIATLAEEFILKIAEHQYANTAPKDVKAKDLDWIDEQTRQEIIANKNNEEYRPFDKAHNPPGIIADEKIWNRAKKIVKPYAKKYENKWAVIFNIYKKLG